MQLSQKIPLLVASAVIATGVAAGTVAVVVGRDSVRESSFSATRAGANTYAESVSVYLRGAIVALESIADRREISEGWGGAGSGGDLVNEDQGVAQRGVLREVLDHGVTFESIALVTPTGKVHLLEPSSLQASLSRPDVGYLPWFKQIAATGVPVVSDVHISTATRRPSVVVAVPVHGRGGRLVGYLAGGLRLAEISALGGSPTGAYFGYLTDTRGLVVAHGRVARYAAEQTDFSEVPSVREALAGRSGAIEAYNAIEDEDRVSGYAPLGELGWAVVYVVPTAVAFAPADRLVSTVAIATLVLVLVTGLGALFFARRAMTPLDRLARAAAAIAGGDRSMPLPPPGKDEVGRLAEEFRRMVDALANREAQLRQRATELEASVRELESFSYSVAHDLRAPLRAVDGFSRMVLERLGTTLDAESIRQLTVVRDEAQRMGDLIDDLLAFAGLGRREIALQRVDPEPIVRAAYAELAPELVGRTVDFRMEPLPACTADPALLRQVFVNLLSNAVKFTRQRGVARIEIGAQQVETGSLYFVRDNGVGFDMAFAERVFGVFQRLWRQEEYEGTGVGLAIVRRVVERHGGRIWVESAPDAGTTFFFTLQESTP